MIVGIGLFATIITVLAGSIINKVTDKFKQKNGVSYMKDHMIICGYTEITKCLIKDYLNSHIDNLIVIEKNYQQKFINIDEEQKNILSMQNHMTMMHLSKQILVKQKVFLYLMKKILIIF
ncbi:hypothetical protein [Francisella tularensis]|uniref:hypothetical protein n=1 Tax=Francisella tularensis TaxID=263 RepID=UPI00031EFD46|nr:hypothetical protein [Francisella tularensis]AJI62216.1 putative potassium channel protein [Francisella tularensis subsp. tularensis]AKU74385.1 putative potassium channel protein [Francisella tularensis subsp. tularensis]KFJ64323.1 potassium channel domain protein [Francisella tularensis]